MIPSSSRISALSSSALLGAVLLAFHFCGCDYHDQTSRQEPPANVSLEDGLSLSFYAIPECFLCETLRHELAELEERYAPRLRFREYDYHLEMSQQGIARFQLGTHGIVISDGQGNAFWTWKAHDEMKVGLQQTIERILTSTPAI